MAERHPAWQLVYAIEMDLRAAGAKMQELRSVLAGLDLPEPEGVACPFCGLRTKGAHTLSEHIYISHEGVVPPQWEETDRLAE